MYSLDEVKSVDPEIASCIVKEEERQNSHIEPGLLSLVINHVYSVAG